MKLFLILLLSLNITIVFSQTQTDMNQSAHRSFKEVDKELNEVYQQILSTYKSDTEFIKNLRASQRIWITFRDAELKMKYPDREPGYYGSIHSMCVSEYLAQLTNQRIKTLKVWLIGIEEGDACSGTIKTKD